VWSFSLTWAGAVAMRSRPTDLRDRSKRARYHRRVMAAADPRYEFDEARALIPRLRSTLIAIAIEERRLAAAHGALHAHLRGNGAAGHATETGRLEREVTRIREGIRGLLAEFDALGVVVRDLEMGLLDIPGERNGERVWLCWRLSDPELAWWHTPHEGYTSRRPW
jgi:hypothetical protein